jgi:hypothetical protein
VKLTPIVWMVVRVAESAPPCASAILRLAPLADPGLEHVFDY